MQRYLILKVYSKITKCVGNAIKDRHLFPGVESLLLAYALAFNGV